MKLVQAPRPAPVVAAVVILPKEHREIKFIRDSKLLSPKQKKRTLYQDYKRCEGFGVGIISHRTIDEIGISKATKLAAKEAVNMLKIKPDFLLIDALDLKGYCDFKQKAIIKGDQKVYTISCASIIAKVTRDNLMSTLGGDYKKYEFDLHKGYGTKRHQELLERFGPCDIHRLSYKPLSRYL